MPYQGEIIMSYNTSPFSGTVARIEKNTVAIGFTGSWTLTAPLKLISTTSQGDIWDTNIVDTGSWSGSFNGDFVAGNTEQKALIDNILHATTPGVLLTDMVFLLDIATNGLYGDLYISGVTIAASKGAIVTAAFNFTGNGALTISDAT